MDSHNEIDNKYLVVKAKGGMGNRMLCAITGILYGQLTGRITIVDWRDKTYSNDGSNTFGRFFSCPGVCPETILPDSSSVYPSLWAGKLHRSIDNMFSEYDPDKHSSIFIHRKYSIDPGRLDYADDILVFWYYTERIAALRTHLQDGKCAFRGFSVWQIIRKVLKEQMLLQDDICRKVEQFKASHWRGKVIGLHVRHTDRQTNLAKYERHLRRFLAQEPDMRIFLATDNEEVSEYYQSRYDNVLSTPKWFPSGMTSMHQNETCPDKVANAIEALVDMYLLAECDYLIYPGCSTFSWISRMLSDMPSENVIDIDHMNPKVRLKRLIRELVA